MAWHPLGWSAAWLSEIEPFPSAVLAHHYPDVPNLGDMTTLPKRILLGEVEAPDVLCGGTPCQSWSVAGKRGGADDPRGQLTFSFLEIAAVAKPRFIVWENVPGILSADKGRSFCQFLDGLLGLGYTINCDILDAQFFGLAQRRRRVFVLCQHASFLMKEKSNTSVSTGAIAVLGILQNILEGLFPGSENSPEKSAVKCESVRAGLERKTKCFLVQPEELLQTWLQNLAEAFLSAATERECWESSHGLGTKTAANLSQSAGTQLSVFQDETVMPSRCLNTSQLWKNELEELFRLPKSFTTLTELKAITGQKICIYAEMLHTIGWFISQSKDACPHLLRLESLHSTLTKEFTKYARQSNEPVFRGERIFGFWDDFSSKTRTTGELVASARAGFDPAAVLFEFDGVRRDSAPSRETGKDTSGSTGDGVARCVTAGEMKRQDWETCTMVAQPINFGAQMSVPQVDFNLNQTLQAKNPMAVAHSVRLANTSSNGWGIQEEVTHTLDCTAGPAIQSAMQVRRLLPEECESLMGFPRGYTAIPWRKKPASECPDGPRYKALGNSWAVPVVRWIGSRIHFHIHK